MSDNNKKYSNGAFVFYRIGSVPTLTEQQIIDIASDYSIPCIPEYKGDRNAASRAIHDAALRLLKSFDIKITKITAKDDYIIYGVSNVNVDDIEEYVEHDDTEDNLIWDYSIPDSFICDNDDVEAIVNECYLKYYKKIISYDWTDSITEYLTEYLDAVSFRDDGRVYWIEASKMNDLNNFGGYLEKVNIHLIICEVQGEQQITSVREAVTESLSDRLNTLKEEVDNFDGMERPSTYSNRIEEYKILKAKAIKYRDVLGIATNSIEETLRSLESKVSDMLDVRNKIRITHDGEIRSK